MEKTKLPLLENNHNIEEKSDEIESDLLGNKMKSSVENIVNNEKLQIIEVSKTLDGIIKSIRLDIKRNNDNSNTTISSMFGSDITINLFGIIKFGSDEIIIEGIREISEGEYMIYSPDINSYYSGELKHIGVNLRDIVKALENADITYNNSIVKKDSYISHDYESFDELIPFAKNILRWKNTGGDRYFDFTIFQNLLSLDDFNSCLDNIEESSLMSDYNDKKFQERILLKEKNDELLSKDIASITLLKENGIITSVTHKEFGTICLGDYIDINTSVPRPGYRGVFEWEKREVIFISNDGMLIRFKNSNGEMSEFSWKDLFRDPEYQKSKIISKNII